MACRLVKAHPERWVVIFDSAVPDNATTGLVSMETGHPFCMTHQRDDCECCVTLLFMLDDPEAMA